MGKRARSKSAGAKTYKRARAKTPNQRAVMTKSLTAPAGLVVTLRYSARYDLDTALSDFNVAIFRALGAYDPEYAVGGHQPLGFDSWSTMYNRYRVLQTKCTVDYIANDATNHLTVTPFLCLKETDTVFSNADTFREQPYCKWGPTLIADGVSSCRLSQICNTANFEGDSGALYDKDYTAPTSGLPNREIYFFVGAQGGDINDTSVVCKVLVNLEYKIRFHDRFDQDRQ